MRTFTETLGCAWLVSIGMTSYPTATPYTMRVQETERCVCWTWRCRRMFPDSPLSYHGLRRTKSPISVLNLMCSFVAAKVAM